MVIAYGENTVIVVFGASGDLAKKKTYPALFGLYVQGVLPKNTKIIGYARSKMTEVEYKDRISSYFKLKNEKLKALKGDFLNICSYISGQYDTPEGFIQLNKEIEALDKASNTRKSQRLFYLALPPSAFTSVAKNLKENVYPKNGYARIIVEKPFGHDLESATALQSSLAPLWSEDELFRIDHYLGKEMVKNLLVLRFGNELLNASWNKNSISSIQISFKESFGTEGRGGYFDNIGIIRDVIQNHLLQVLTLLTMERPVSFDPESIRDEKVKVLKAIAPIDHNDILLGQYTKSEDGSKPGYLDDETVNPNSKCVTYAAIGLKIVNERWDGVPIVLRAGKALNDGKVEIRIQFKEVAKGIFSSITRNELVIRVQPNEAVYLKINSKIPGVSTQTSTTDLDLTYSSRYSKDFWIPEAYESLIRDCLHGEHSNFVRDDELDISWRIFTPLLNHIESEKGPKPLPYTYGSRGPAPLAEFLKKHGYVFGDAGVYQWPITKPEPGSPTNAINVSGNL